jgi:hypothetical protein
MRFRARIYPTSASLIALGFVVIVGGTSLGLLYRSQASELLASWLPQTADGLAQARKATSPADAQSVGRSQQPISSARGDSAETAFPHPSTLAAGIPSAQELAAVSPNGDEGSAPPADLSSSLLNEPGSQAGDPTSSGSPNGTFSGGPIVGGSGSTSAPQGGPLASGPDGGVTPFGSANPPAGGPLASPVGSSSPSGGSPAGPSQPTTVFNQPSFLDGPTSPTSSDGGGGGGGGGLGPVASNAPGGTPSASPAAPGSTPGNPIVPVSKNGSSYNLPINPRNSTWQFFDPAVAIGYNYQLTPKNAGDALTFGITNIMVTTKVGNGVYQLWLYDLLTQQWVDTGQSIIADPSANTADAFNVVAFLQNLALSLTAENESLAEVYGITDLTMGLTEFSIRGIDPSAGLDPYNPNAFITGLLFAGNINGDLQITPLAISTDTGQAVDPPTIVEPIPEPPSLWVLIAGLAVMVLVARRNRRRVRLAGSQRPAATL